MKLSKSANSAKSISFIESEKLSEFVSHDSWRVVKKETCKEFSFTQGIVWISTRRESVTTECNSPQLIEQVSWTVRTPVIGCEAFSAFRQDLASKDFSSLCKKLAGENWTQVATEIFTKATSAEIETSFRLELSEGSGIFEEETKPISITFNGTTGSFTVKGNEVEFWELPVPDVIVTSSQFGEILAKYQGPGRDRHVLEILFDLKIAQIRDLVEEVRLLYSVPLTQAPEFACGTVMMNRNQPSLLGLLLRPRWRIK